MKRSYIISAIFFAALTIGIDAFAGKMDLTLRSIVSKGGSDTTSFSLSKAQVVKDGRILIPCLIKSDDNLSVIEAIARVGGRISHTTKDIISAEIPIDELELISAMDEVIAMEGPGLLRPKMDTARHATQVDDLQAGTTLVTPYDGTNVVVGVVDNVLDYGHPDFGSRVQYLYQRGTSTDTECFSNGIAAGSCTINGQSNQYYHGTHVTGIAAGGDATYTGVAKNADIMFYFFGTTTDSETSGTTDGSFSTVILEGVSKIFEKADELDKPAVVNLSVGTSLGAHDGTSLLEQGLTALSTAKGGRIIVNAAGNEQANAGSLSGTSAEDHVDDIGGIHAPISVADGTSKASRVAVIDSNSAVINVGGTYVDIWLTEGDADHCSIAVFGYTNGRSSFSNTLAPAATSDASLASDDVPMSADTASPVIATGGSVKASIAVDASDPRNSKPHAQILLEPSSSAANSVLGTMWFDVVVRASGGTCSGNMWLYYDYVAYNDFLKGVTGNSVASAAKVGYSLIDGDSQYTTTIPATASGVIAAGSYMPEKPISSGTSVWRGDDGADHDQSVISDGGTGTIVGDLSVFSSLGPTVDGRTKPDIVAPGEPIISTLNRGFTRFSSSATVGGSHVKVVGTSMASPHVTGIVALLLQRNHDLTVDEVRAALRTGAATSGLTAKYSDNENSFGAGKVMALSALQSVSADTSAYPGSGDLVGVSGDPADGSAASSSGGCALSAVNDESTVALASFLILAVISTIAAIFIRKRTTSRKIS